MGLKLNFSQQEANSEARTVEILPTGEYHCNVVKVETKTVNPGSDNAGKPYWNIRFVVQDGRYEGSSIFSNVMLFEGKDGTLGMLAQLLKALGYHIEPNTPFELPEDDELEGKALTVVGFKQAKRVKNGQEQPERFNVNGFKVWDQKAKPKSGNTTLMP